jgi:hypothetical protein
MDIIIIIIVSTTQVFGLRVANFSQYTVLRPLFHFITNIPSPHKAATSLTD